MDINYNKYHALQNDFIVLDFKKKPSADKLSEIAQIICNRRTGVGADGIICLSASSKADSKFDIYNSDGSWAEISGNGLRIAGYHLYRASKRKSFTFETSDGLNKIQIMKPDKSAMMIKTELGTPEFNTKKIPVKSKSVFMINAPLDIEGNQFPVTCLSIGNPHAVLIVENFDFDWQTLGETIEYHKVFPNRTNVEFVKPVNRKKIKVADWERGAGATGSSGTGAAAAVAACVTLGFADRECEAVFEKGSLFINWRDDNMIELTGPVEFVTEGNFKI